VEFNLYTHDLGFPSGNYITPEDKSGYKNLLLSRFKFQPNTNEIGHHRIKKSLPNHKIGDSEDAVLAQPVFWANFLGEYKPNHQFIAGAVRVFEILKTKSDFSDANWFIDFNHNRLSLNPYQVAINLFGSGHDFLLISAVAEWSDEQSDVTVLGMNIPLSVQLTQEELSVCKEIVRLSACSISALRTSKYRTRSRTEFIKTIR